MNIKIEDRSPENDPLSRIEELSDVERHYLGVLSICTYKGEDFAEEILEKLLNQSDEEFQSPGWKVLKERFISLGLVSEKIDNMIHMPSATWNWANEHIDEL